MAEVHCDDRIETLAELRNLALEPQHAGLVQSLGSEVFCGRPRLFRERSVIRVPRFDEQGFDLSVRNLVDEVPFAKRRTSAKLRELTSDPLKGLDACLSVG